MAEQYTARALEAVHAILAGGALTAELRAVETDAGLTANSLTDPAAVLRFWAPNDNRSPLIMVYPSGGEAASPAGQRHRKWSCDLVVHWQRLGTPDMDASAMFAARYHGAVLEALKKNERPATDVAIFLGAHQHEVFPGQDRPLLFAWAQSVTVVGDYS